MKIHLSILVLLTSLVVNSQSRGIAYIQMIDSLIRRIQPQDTIYYSDKLQKDRVVEVTKTLPKELDRIKKRGLVFTDSEKKYIISNLKKVFHFKQENNLFPLSKRLSSDSIIRFVEMKIRKTIDSLRQSTDSKAGLNYYMYKKPWAFCFSYPIYLRKGTILLYYFMYYANSSGEDGVRVCKKENSKWTRVGTLGGSAW